MKRMQQNSLTSSLLTQQALVETYLRRSSSLLATFSFADLWAWQDFFTYSFRVMDGYLCVFARHALGTFMYWPPLGRPLTRRILDQCFEFMRQENGGIGVGRIENVGHGQQAFFADATHVLTLKSREYLYYRRDIANLRGQKYARPRWLCNHFQRAHAYSYEPYTAAMQDECLALYAHWVTERGRKDSNEIYGMMLEEAAQAHQRILAAWPCLGLVGRVVKVDGRIRAYTFGAALARRVFSCHLEVADLHYKGLPAFCFREFCRDPALEDFDFINAMDDCGRPQLRQTKMGYRPVLLAPVYGVRQR